MSTRLVLVLLLVACGSPAEPFTGGPGDEPGDPGPVVVPAPVAADDADDADTEPVGLVLRLTARTAADGGGDGEPAPTPVTTPLDPARVEALLARLPPLPEDDTGTVTFALPPASLPAPRPGTDRPVDWPPTEPAGARPATGPDGALTVERFAPEGDVLLAPALSVTFSEPMVPLSSHRALAWTEVPVRLQPEVPGRWRWIGTRTLVFEPEVRFPMATAFEASLPLGTTSATGARLGRPVSWRFATPAPRLVTHRVGRPGPDALLFLGFDQAIDAAAVAERIEIRDHLFSGFDVRLATDQEIEADESVAQAVERAEPGRFVVVRATEPLPLDEDFDVVVGAGTPSAEGPRVTAEDQSFAFETYGPLEVEDFPRGTLEPEQAWSIEFTNRIAYDERRDEWVSIEPELPGRTLHWWGDRLHISGEHRPRTTYTVTLAAELRDVFDQTLGRARRLAFEVGPARPALAARSGVIVADPMAPATYPVSSRGLEGFELELRRVEPSDWPAFARGQDLLGRRGGHGQDDATWPGEVVTSGPVAVASDDPDATVTTVVDLSPALDGDRGHVLVLVRPRAGDLVEDEDDVDEVSRHWWWAAWVQRTGLAVDAISDRDDLVVWVNALTDGAPVPGARVTLLGGSGPQAPVAATDARGLAPIDLPEPAAGPQWILVEADGDRALLPSSTRWYDWAEEPRRTPRLTWARTEALDVARFFSLDDRHLYKPGETVSVKGWVRRLEYGPGGDVQPAQDWVGDVSWTATDPRGQELATGAASLDRWGGFALSFDLPAGGNLGWGRVRYTVTSADGREHHGSHGFEVQDFRRPEYEVSVSVSEGPHLVGGTAVATVDARYYSGGALPGADTAWHVSAVSTTYRPPGHDDFVFGVWVPWWHGRSSGTSVSETLTARTDDAGRHQLDVAAVSLDPPLPQRVTAQASVVDVNRQEWTAASSWVLHPGETYVGLRTERTFLRTGQDLELALLAVDIDGGVVLDRAVEVVAERLQWKSGSDGWTEQTVDRRVRTVASAAEPVPVSFDLSDDPVRGGRWRVTATVRDEAGRPNRSELTLWVAGGSRPGSRGVTQEEVELVPDRESYEHGDVAEILVQAPFAPAEGLLVLERAGHLERRRFRMDEPSTVLSVPITEAHVPSVTVEVQLVGASVRTDDDGAPLAGAPPRPAYASGTLVLDVPPLRRVLEVTAAPRDETLEPGGETVVDVAVVDVEGEPVADGQVVVLVVDESILALSGRDWDDPIPVFHPRRSAGGSTQHSRAYVTLAEGRLVDGTWRFVEPADLASGFGRGFGAKFGARAGALAPSAARADGDVFEEALAELGYVGDDARDADGGEASGDGGPIRLRTDFSPLALFETSAITGADGTVAVPVTLPDNLTRYRVVAFATDGVARFGRGESAITARLPLMVRPSPPRFLSWGDVLELPIVLQNGTDEDLPVELGVGASRLELTGPAGLAVTVPAHDRVEVRLPAEAVEVGTARMWIAAAAADRADAAFVTLPVWTPATVEAFATYGTVDDAPAWQPVLAPADVHPEFGGLALTTSSTALASLSDAVLYLHDYPFGCTEQVASRVIGMLAVADVLEAFEAPELPDREALLESLQRDVDLILTRSQGEDGFRLWDRGDPWPFTSLHAAHALLRARDAGLEVPDDRLEQALAYCGRASRLEDPWAASYSEAYRRTLAAYATWVLDLAGRAGTLGAARELIRQARNLDALPLEACAWLLDALADEPAAVSERASLLRHLGNRVTETASTAEFTERYTDGAHLLMHGDRRTDALALTAWLAVDPDDELVVKLVRGLQAHRVRGRWRTTQENCFVLLALRAYFDRFERQTPDFTARAWLGNRDAGSQRFVGRDAERRQLQVPMAELLDIAAAGDDGRADLVLSKEGAGRLYYRLGLSVAPDDLLPEPAEHGFAVERRYEAIEDADDVWRDDDGTWHVKAGAMVRVVVTMVAPARRYHVALVDPLPAGLEPMNPDLATTRDLSGVLDDEDTPWWHWTWYRHDNLRDDRAEAFATSVSAGVHVYRYVARATTPGTFLAPPPRAEEMYAPETWGRGEAGRLVVERPGR